MAALGRLRLARPGRGWLIGLAATWFVGVLLLASPAGASHPLVTPEIGPLEIDASAPDPTLVESLPPATPGAAALICLVVLTLPAILAARQWRRTATLATLGLLVWFSAEAAFHSAHHATEPEEAEHCQVFSAAQHLPGVDPVPAVPVLERPAPVAVAPLPLPAVAAAVVLDGEQARAPPARPA
jgi:Protein of unknown function (DUF2607)